MNPDLNREFICPDIFNKIDKIDIEVFLKIYNDFFVDITNKSLLLDNKDKINPNVNFIEKESDNEENNNIDKNILLRLQTIMNNN